MFGLGLLTLGIVGFAMVVSVVGLSSLFTLGGR